MPAITLEAWLDTLQTVSARKTVYDILQSLRNVYDVTQAGEIRERALALIETEADAKYRKKYAMLWKAV